MKWGAVIVCGLWLACPASAAAHRLDEYLQATRIALGPDAVDVEIDLTPGVGVAAKVIALMDVDGDGDVSPAERDAYARLVVGRAELRVDGQPRPLELVGSEYPSTGEMRAGTGTVHLRARATLPAWAAGRHQLAYVNIHQPEMGAYLVNALVPPPNIRITDQQRDVSQHQLRLDYVVDSAAGRWSRRVVGLGLATLLMCLLGWFRIGRWSSDSST